MSKNFNKWSTAGKILGQGKSLGNGEDEDRGRSGGVLGNSKTWSWENDVGISFNLNLPL